MKIVVAILSLLLTTARLGQAEGLPPVPFAVGETLHYRLYWGPLPVGHATLEVRGIEPLAGRPCYHLVAEARTTGPGRLLYRVDVIAESWLDTQTLATLRHRNHRVEGARVQADETTFDYAQQRATMTNLLKHTVKTCRLDGPVVDILGALYLVRTRPLRLANTEELTVNANATNTRVRIKPDHPRTFRVQPLGDVPAFRLEPEPTLKLISRHQGRLWFWISDDHRRLLLSAVTELKFGRARVVLSKIEPPPSPAVTKIATAY